MLTGMVRRIDELGRIVIPKEIRTTLRIKNGDSMEILVSESEEIVLKKYSHIENAIDVIKQYAESFHQVLKYNVLITDTDKVIAASGNLKNKYLNKIISNKIVNLIERRDNLTSLSKDALEITEELLEKGFYAVHPIISNGDSVGSVIFLSESAQISNEDVKLSHVLANILGNYLGG